LKNLSLVCAKRLKRSSATSKIAKLLRRKMNNQDTTVTPNARLAEQRARIGMVTLQTEEKELVVSGETEAEGAEAEAEVSKIVVNRSVGTTKKEPKAVVLEGEIAILNRKMEWKNKGREERISRAK
jgi:hypothetical protein